MVTSTASILLLERVIYIPRRWHVRRPSSSYLHAYSGGKIFPQNFRQDFRQDSFAKTFATAAYPPRPPRTCTSRAVLKSTGHSAFALLGQFFISRTLMFRPLRFLPIFAAHPLKQTFFERTVPTSKRSSYTCIFLVLIPLLPPPRPRPSLFLWLSQNIDYKQRASHPNCTTYINYYQIIMIGDV